jgi:hypothetical protein
LTHTTNWVKQQVLEAKASGFLCAERSGEGMSETDDFNKATANTDVPAPVVKPNAIAPAAMVAELESLIGQARGSANEAENHRQAALKSATDAELARTKG